VTPSRGVTPEWKQLKSDSDSDRDEQKNVASFFRKNRGVTPSLVTHPSDATGYIGSFMFTREQGCRQEWVRGCQNTTSYFHLNVQDNNDRWRLSLYVTKLTLAITLVGLRMLHFTGQYTKAPFEEDRWFWCQFVPNLLGYTCTSNYLNKKSFDKVIAKIIWCSFFASQYILAMIKLFARCIRLRRYEPKSMKIVVFEGINGVSLAKNYSGTRSRPYHTILRVGKL